MKNSQNTQEPQYRTIIDGRLFVGTKAEIEEAIRDDRENRG